MLGLLLAISVCPVPQEAPRAEAATTPPATPLRDVWRSGEGGYATYRIPALVTAANGDVLAFAEGRRDGSGDAGDIDLVLKRSKNGGRTWSEQEVVWDDGPNTCGNPCPVLDRGTGRLLLLVTHNLGHDTEREIIDGTAEGTRTVWLLTSDDHGATWSEPRSLTAQVKRPTWTWYATGPGAGIQLRRGFRAGRLVVPCDHIEKDTKRYFSHVIYSDDHGASWRIGGSSPEDQVNECAVVELPSGDLMLDMRNYDRSQHTRQVAFSSDAGVTWRAQRHDPTRVEPICQASLHRLRWPGRTGPSTLLFANPANPDARVNMTLRASFDDGATWPLERVLFPGPSAYSALTSLSDETILCLFEADDYTRIALARVPGEWATPTDRK